MENENNQYIIAYANKTVLRISGLKVKGLNTEQVEQALSEKLQSMVRIIGVTGEDIEMDVYNLDPEQISKNEQGVIDALALMKGVKVTDLARMTTNKKIKEVDFENIPDQPLSPCARERWMMLK